MPFGCFGLSQSFGTLGVVFVHATGVYAGLRHVNASDWVVVPLRGLIISLAWWSLSAEAMFLVVLAWLWTCACLHGDNVAHRVSHAADLAVDAHQLQRQRPPGYILENVSPLAHRPGTKIRDEVFGPYIASVIDRPVSFDAARAGSLFPPSWRRKGPDSRAFRASRMGTVVRSFGTDSEEESREVNLDETKSRAMGYSANELRMADGLNDEELTSILGLAMDRRAMELLMAVEEASRKGLPHSEESLVAENSPGQPIAVDNNWADHARSDLQQRQALLAKWVGNSSAYTQQVAPALPVRLNKPRFAARWTQLRRNLVLHRVAQTAYLALVFAFVVFAAAGGAHCTSWESQQSSRQWESGWEANIAEQDGVLLYTVLDELQPLGKTTVTKDEAAWLDTPELNATFGGHPDFKEEHWEEMRAVLRRCKGTFANTPHDLTGYKGKAVHNTFSIPFKDESKAVYQKPRKYSPGEQEIIDIHCKELLDYGFIEPAAKHCKHASNVVVAGKKDHETEEHCQKAAKARFKTTLDATKAFHQIPMATEEDRNKTAFWWKNQLYQYTSMPLGAAGATSAFVRIMDYELRHLQHCTVAYVDDMVVYTDSTPEQHLKDVEEEAKCKATQDLPKPQDKTGLRSILIMMNYYKGLVGEPGGPNYSEMARPLKDLLKKEIIDIKGAWGNEQGQALQDLKDSLCAGRCLRPIDYDSRLILLYTDWSTFGIGAVLGQKDDDGKEYICMAISRSLSKTERQYASFK
eukprot:gene11003-biopygen11283